MSYIIIGIVVIILLFVLGTYNSLVKLRNLVAEGFSTMDVYLKKRWDLIPNLVNTVKGYTKHEEDTLKEIVNLRNGNYDDLSVSDKVEASNKLNQVLPKIFALAEAYPELKASDNFKDLSNQLTAIENDISNSRKYYNGCVRTYNDKIQVIPSNIVAMIFGFKAYKMFETASNEKENVKVEF